MKIQLARIDDNIVVGKDYSDIKDKGEVSHMLVELELIRSELLDIWVEMDEEEDDRRNTI